MGMGSYLEGGRSVDPGEPDGCLVARLRIGDLDALGELYEKYKSNIYRTALAVTRERGAAEDILQECFLRLFAHADRIQTDVPVGPWLYRVAVNMSYTWIQKRRRWVDSLETVLGRLAAPLHLMPEPLVERSEVQQTVQEAIDGLPLSHRVVVVLFYLEGLSLREVSDVLEIPEGTVKSRLHYARQALKKALEERRSVSGLVYEYT
jgi:RNA polymerase sigma-70 factor (ECF subfamily)